MIDFLARLEKELQEATEDVFLLRMELVECRSELVVLKRRAARWLDNLDALIPEL